MKKYHLLLLTIALTFCGVGMFLYKALCLDYPVVPNTTESRWVVEAHLSFNAKNKAVKAALKIPKSTENFLLMDENFISRGYGLATRTIGDDREATWTRRSAIGRQGLYYRAVIKDGGIDGRVDIPKSRDQTPEGALKEAMNSIIADAKQKSADTETFVTSLIGLFQTKNSNVKMLLGSRPDRAKKAKVAVAILNESGLRARVVHGIFLNVDRNVPITQRVQVLDNKTWLMFDPETSERTGQDLFLPWWYGDADIATVTNASQIRTTISVERFQEEALTAASEYARKVAPKLVDFSLFSLPVETQRVYRVLLLVPIGAFLVVLLRNIVGFVTFGTFMPVLIGLSFRETGLSWGIVLFSLLIGLGVIARFYLESLKLLLVPRLSAVLIIVVLIMAVLSVITHQLGLERGVSVALFPMVIITMTIERMSIVWDELGVFAAFKQGIGTLLVACIIYLIIRSHYLEHLIFVFPELLLVVLAMTLLMGRYSGYRLLELRRFHALTKEPVKND